MPHLLKQHTPVLIIIVLLAVGLVYFAVFRAPAQEETTFVDAGQPLPANCVPPGESLTGDQVHCARRVAGAILGEDALNAEEEVDFGKSLCINSSGKVDVCGEVGEAVTFGTTEATPATVNVKGSGYYENYTGESVGVTLKDIDTAKKMSLEMDAADSGLLRIKNDTGDTKIALDQDGNVGVAADPVVNTRFYLLGGTGVDQAIYADGGTTSGGIVGVSAHSSLAGGQFANLGGGPAIQVLNGQGKVVIGASSPDVTGTGKLHVSGNTARVFDTDRTPASSSETCNTGEMTFDLSYIYVCISTNTWARAALSAF